MNADSIIAEYKAQIESMSESDLLRSLEDVGFVFDQPWMDSFKASDNVRGLFDGFGACDASELALAA
jgi:hypothetical protein